MRRNCLVLDYTVVEPFSEYKYPHSQSSAKIKGNHYWAWLIFMLKKVPFEIRWKGRQQQSDVEGTYCVHKAVICRYS